MCNAFGYVAVWCGDRKNSSPSLNTLAIQVTFLIPNFVHNIFMAIQLIYLLLVRMQKVALPKYIILIN